MSKRTKVIAFIGFIAVVAVFSFVFMDGLMLKSARNYLSSFGAKPEKIEILIKDKNFDIIKEDRERCLEIGTIMGERYVPAKIVYKEDTFKVEMRLKGHMLDHLKGDKWSYRIKTKKGKTIMGMQRFSIQHPGTRNYMYEWIHQKLMEQEGIVTLQYDFIEVKLNDKDLGVYALEEHFAQELVERNGRPKGAILRFDPDLYWKGRRLRDLDKHRFKEEFSGYQASFPEALDSDATFEDSTLKKSYLAAQAQLERFKYGELTTSQVFDVEKLAKFHVVKDIIGGFRSLDWSDVKYYHNTKTNLIEPIAYESVSAFAAHEISGMNTFVHPKKRSKLHEFMFSDEQFYTLYMRELQKRLNAQYFNAFFQKIDAELAQKLNIIYSEFPYKDFKVDVYYNNIKRIKSMLDEQKPFHIFTQNYTQDSIELALGSNSAFPYYIHAIECGNERIKLDIKTLVYAKKSREKVAYETYNYPINAAFYEKLKEGKKISVFVSIIGVDERKEIDVFDYPYQRLLDKEKTQRDSL